MTSTGDALASMRPLIVAYPVGDRARVVRWMIEFDQCLMAAWISLQSLDPQATTAARYAMYADVLLYACACIDDTCGAVNSIARRLAASEVARRQPSESSFGGWQSDDDMPMWRYINTYNRVSFENSSFHSLLLLINLYGDGSDATDATLPLAFMHACTSAIELQWQPLSHPMHRDWFAAIAAFFGATPSASSRNVLTRAQRLRMCESVRISDALTMPAPHFRVRIPRSEAQCMMLRVLMCNIDAHDKPRLRSGLIRDLDSTFDSSHALGADEHLMLALLLHERRRAQHVAVAHARRLAHARAYPHAASASASAMESASASAMESDALFGVSHERGVDALLRRFVEAATACSYIQGPSLFTFEQKPTSHHGCVHAQRRYFAELLTHPLLLDALPTHRAILDARFVNDIAMSLAYIAMWVAADARIPTTRDVRERCDELQQSFSGVMATLRALTLAPSRWSAVPLSVSDIYPLPICQWQPVVAHAIADQVLQYRSDLLRTTHQSRMDFDPYTSPAIQRMIDAVVELARQSGHDSSNIYVNAKLEALLRAQTVGGGVCAYRPALLERARLEFDAQQSPQMQSELYNFSLTLDARCAELVQRLEANPAPPAQLFSLTHTVGTWSAFDMYRFVRAGGMETLDRVSPNPIIH